MGWGGLDHRPVEGRIQGVPGEEVHSDTLGQESLEKVSSNSEPGKRGEYLEKM